MAQQLKLIRFLAVWLTLLCAPARSQATAEGGSTADHINVIQRWTALDNALSNVDSVSKPAGTTGDRVDKYLDDSGDYFPLSSTTNIPTLAPPVLNASITTRIPTLAPPVLDASSTTRVPTLAPPVLNASSTTRIPTLAPPVFTACERTSHPILGENGRAGDEHCDAQFADAAGRLRRIMCDPITRIIVIGCENCPCLGIAKSKFDGNCVNFNFVALPDPQCDSDMIRYMRCRIGTWDDSFVFFRSHPIGASYWKFVGDGQAMRTLQNFSKHVYDSGARKTANCKNEHWLKDQVLPWSTTPAPPSTKPSNKTTKVTTTKPGSGGKDGGGGSSTLSTKTATTSPAGKKTDRLRKADNKTVSTNKTIPVEIEDVKPNGGNDLSSTTFPVGKKTDRKPDAPTAKPKPPSKKVILGAFLGLLVASLCGCCCWVIFGAGKKDGARDPNPQSNNEGAE